MESLKNNIDINWVKENPDSAKELIDLLIDQKNKDKDYIESLERKYSLLRHGTLLLRSLVESLNNKEE